MEFSFYNSIPRPSSAMKLVIQSEKVKSNLEVNRFDLFLLNEKFYWLGETKSDRRRQERTFSISLCNEMIYNDVNNSELAFFKRSLLSQCYCS